MQVVEEARVDTAELAITASGRVVPMVCHIARITEVIMYALPREPGVTLDSQEPVSIRFVVRNFFLLRRHVNLFWRANRLER